MNKLSELLVPSGRLSDIDMIPNLMSVALKYILTNAGIAKNHNSKAKIVSTVRTTNVMIAHLNKQDRERTQ